MIIETSSPPHVLAAHLEAYFLNPIAAYLLATFGFWWIYLIAVRHKVVSEGSSLVYVQLVSLVVFFLVYGGNSIDAWRYLTRFTHNPLGFDEEWLFWLTGNFLSQVLPNPWPVKILSALAVTLWIWAVIRAIGTEKKDTLVLGIALLPLIPAFFFTVGNAIRQGLASVIVLHAIVFLLAKKRWQFGLVGATGILVHLPSLVFVLASAGMRIPRKALWTFLIVAPFVSFGVSFVLEFWQVNLADYIRYAHRDDGQLHYLKFAFYFLASIGLLIFSSKRPVPEYLISLINVFVITVSFALMLLRYEVPFERILLYADVLLPIIFAMVIAELKLGIKTKRFLWSGAVCAGLLLWTSGAVKHTLTAGLAHVEDGRIEFYQIPD